MKKISHSLGALALALSTSTHAASCVESPLSNARAPEVRVATHQAVHLEFPEAIVRPVMGDTVRWQFAAFPETPAHLWITPTEQVPEGGATSLTVLTTSGAFNFVLTRASDAPTCYRFYFEQAIGSMSLAPAPTSAPAPMTAALPSPGRYAWKSREISEVNDDGRFTFVRFRDVPRRLPAITDDAGGPVEAKWNATERTYRIVGLFDGLKIHLGRRPIEIKRES